MGRSISSGRVDPDGDREYSMLSHEAESREPTRKELMSMTMEELKKIAFKRQLEQNIEILLDEYAREHGVMIERINVTPMVIRKDGKVTDAHHRASVIHGMEARDEAGEAHEAANI